MKKGGVIQRGLEGAADPCSRHRICPAQLQLTLRMNWKKVAQGSALHITQKIFKIEQSFAKLIPSTLTVDLVWLSKCLLLSYQIQMKLLWVLPNPRGVRYIFIYPSPLIRSRFLLCCTDFVNNVYYWSSNCVLILTQVTVHQIVPCREIAASLYSWYVYLWYQSWNCLVISRWWLSCCDLLYNGEIRVS